MGGLRRVYYHSKREVLSFVTAKDEDVEHCAK